MRRGCHGPGTIHSMGRDLISRPALSTPLGTESTVCAAPVVENWIGDSPNKLDKPRPRRWASCFFGDFPDVIFYTKIRKNKRKIAKCFWRLRLPDPHKPLSISFTGISTYLPIFLDITYWLTKNQRKNFIGAPLGPLPWWFFNLLFVGRLWAPQN